jgi:hypothetical protein
MSWCDDPCDMSVSVVEKSAHRKGREDPQHEEKDSHFCANPFG